MEIPDDKLYREFFISERSKYHGKWKIYWNREICEKFGHKVYVWREDDIRNIPQFSYVQADDGVCVPIFNVKHYRDKNNRDYYFCRFPVGTVYFYKSIKDNQFKYNNFYGNLSARNANQLSWYGTEKAIQKKRWVNLVLAGVNPVTAAVHVFQKKYSPTLVSFVLRLMNDKIVVKEIKSQLDSFREKLNLEFTDEDFIKELKSLIQNSRKGTLSHKENIKFLLELTGRISPSMSIKKIKSSEEADFEELPPAEP